MSKPNADNPVSCQCPCFDHCCLCRRSNVTISGSPEKVELGAAGACITYLLGITKSVETELVGIGTLLVNGTGTALIVFAADRVTCVSQSLADHFQIAYK